MYIIDGIAYAGDGQRDLRVSGIRPLQNFSLWVRFNTGEVKIVDLNSMLDKPAYSPLKDKNLFNSVYIDYGVPVWCDGDIDIAPEYLYENGVSYTEDAIIYRSDSGNYSTYEEYVADSLQRADIKVSEGKMKYYTADEIISEIEESLQQ